MIKMKYGLFILICLGFLGCAPLLFFGAGTAAGIAGYKYYQGKLTVVYQAPFIETWDASLKALENLKCELLSEKHHLTSGKVDAKCTDGRPVTVSFEYKSARETKVDIRVGLLGNKAASMAIKDEIKKVLFRG